VAYFIVTYFVVKIICVDKKYTRWIIYIYGLLLLLSGISMTYNYIFNSNLDGDEYTLSRWLMGIAQSPLVAFFMIAANKLYEKTQTQP
jgi:general stress protein CsbA